MICPFYLYAIVDTMPPNVTYCPDDIMTYVDYESLGTIVNWTEPKAVDTSTYVMLLLQTHVPGTFFATGTTIVTYIFKDEANNMGKCTFSVTVTTREINFKLKVFKLIQFNFNNEYFK